MRRLPTPPFHDATDTPSTIGTTRRAIDATIGSALLTQIVAAMIAPMATTAEPNTSSGVGTDRAPMRSRPAAMTRVMNAAMTASHARTRAATTVPDHDRVADETTVPVPVPVAVLVPVDDGDGDSHHVAPAASPEGAC